MAVLYLFSTLALFKCFGRGFIDNMSGVHDSRG